MKKLTPLINQVFSRQNNGILKCMAIGGLWAKPNIGFELLLFAWYTPSGTSAPSMQGRYGYFP
ncbi:hypothetical protein GF373_04525 [bacterium]|nr:hypothetical protein [bacterium]